MQLILASEIAAKQRSKEAMPRNSPQSTLSTSTYDCIRQDILSGKLTPGFKLRIDFVASRYGAGNSPIREALSRLSSDGLVERHEQRGFIVAHISIEQLREVTKTRCWLEEIAIGESIRNVTEVSEDALVIAMHRLSRTERYNVEDPSRINPEWETRHTNFHDALIANCGSSILLQYCRELRCLADRYRLLAAASVPPRKELDEHKAIFAAVMDRSPERASKLLQEHYGITESIIEQRLSEWPSMTRPILHEGTAIEPPKTSADTVKPSKYAPKRGRPRKKKPD